MRRPLSCFPRNGLWSQPISPPLSPPQKTFYSNTMTPRPIRAIILVFLWRGIVEAREETRVRNPTSSSRLSGGAPHHHHRVRGVDRKIIRSLQGKGSTDVLEPPKDIGPNETLPPTKGVIPDKGNASTTPSPSDDVDTTEPPASIPFPPSGSPVVTPSVVPSTAPVTIPVTESPTVIGHSPSSSFELSPSTEMEEERSKTRVLLPFSLTLDGNLQIEDVDQVMEQYLFRRLAEDFENLEWILLAVGSSEQRRTMRNVQQGTVFDFSGDAVFLDTTADDNVPTEQEVQQAQLAALQDFQVFQEYIQEQDFDWQLINVILDGIIVNKEGIIIGDTEIVNDGDSLSREAVTEPQSDNKNGSKWISVSAAVVFLALGAAFLVRRNRRRRSHQDTAAGEKSYSVIVPPEHFGDSDMDDRNVSYETAHLTIASFDSVNVVSESQSPIHSSPYSSMDGGDVAPLFPETTHELVTLAPVPKVPTERRIHDDGDGDGDGGGDDEDEDSYGFEGNQESSGAAASFPLGVDRAAEYSGDDRDITMDLSEFADQTNQTGDSEDEEW